MKLVRFGDVPEISARDEDSARKRGTVQLAMPYSGLLSKRSAAAHKWNKRRKRRRRKGSR